MMSDQEDLDYQSLITTFLAGEATEQELTVLKKWLNADVANRKIFDQAAELWQEASINNKLQIFNADESWEKIHERLKFGNSTDTDGKSTSSMKPKFPKVNLLLR
jgi:hypothetical protein